MQPGIVSKILYRVALLSCLGSFIIATALVINPSITPKLSAIASISMPLKRYSFILKLNCNRCQNLNLELL